MPPRCPDVDPPSPPHCSPQRSPHTESRGVIIDSVSPQIQVGWFYVSGVLLQGLCRSRPAVCSSRTEHCWFREWSRSRSGPVDLEDPSLPFLRRDKDLQKRHESTTILVIDCEDVLLFFVIHVSKWRVFGIWSDKRSNLMVSLRTLGNFDEHLSIKQIKLNNENNSFYAALQPVSHKTVITL